MLITVFHKWTQNTFLIDNFLTYFVTLETWDQKEGNIKKKNTASSWLLGRAHVTFSVLFKGSRDTNLFPELLLLLESAQIPGNV